jgi:hypothetical protein
MSGTLAVLGCPGWEVVFVYRDPPGTFSSPLHRRVFSIGYLLPCPPLFALLSIISRRHLRCSCLVLPFCRTVTFAHSNSTGRCLAAAQGLNWQFSTRLQASDYREYTWLHVTHMFRTRFGSAVALDGRTLTVGAPRGNYGNYSFENATYTTVR